MDRGQGGGALPVLFISHGTPAVAVSLDDFSAKLRAFVERLPAPEGVVVASAHWEEAGPIRVTSGARPEQIYDFFGFPDELYQIRYACPGNPELASRVVRLLNEAGCPAVAEPGRGLDHGAWIPMRLAVPDARIPVVQVSLPVPRRPGQLLRMGKALAPLRSEGILLVGSGGLVHNPGLLRLDDERGVGDDWARTFDEWAWTRLQLRDTKALSDYRKLAPEAARAVPTTEHWDPVFLVLGASNREDSASKVYDGFRYGNLGMRSFFFGGL